MYNKISKLPAINAYFKWLCERSALELSLIGVSFEGEMLLEYLLMNGPSILRLRFKGSPSPKLVRSRIPAGLESVLQHVPNCETVAISGFDLRNAFAVVLKALARHLSLTHLVRYLDFSSNYIGAEGARTIAGNLPSLPKLTSLNFSSNSIGAEGARVIAESLPSLSLLTSLNFSFNFIGAEGAPEIAGNLPSLPQLSSLDFSSNSIGAEGVQLLTKSMSNPRALRVNSIKTKD